MDFERLYNTYYMQVFSCVMTISRHHDTAEEITQQTFFKAFATSLMILLMTTAIFTGGSWFF